MNERIDLMANKNNEKHHIEVLKETKIENYFDAPRGTYVTELFEFHWQNWKAGEQILLSAPMGSGKSYFIYKVLIPSITNKKFLYYPIGEN